MRQSRYAQRKTIAPTETERSADLIGNHRDARGVGMRIMLEFISARAEVLEDLNYRDLLAFNGVDWRHVILTYPGDRFRKLSALIRWLATLYLLFRFNRSTRAASFFGSTARARSSSPSARR